MAGRRGSLIAAAKAASDRVAAEGAAAPPVGAEAVQAPSAAPPAPAAAPQPSEAAAEPRAGTMTADYVTTAIHVPKDVLRLLRRVAVERANREGGRPSVSAVLVELVRANRETLERDAER